MPLSKPIKKILLIFISCILVTSCFSPPYNEFSRNQSTTINKYSGFYNPFNLFRNQKDVLIKKLADEDIQFVVYGDTNTLIIPTDRYYEFNSTQFNELCYVGLNHILSLLKLYPCSIIYVAAFTDNIGSKHHKERLTQGRADRMLTFLWANGYKQSQLKAEGYGDKHPVSNNAIIHGSAQNRRIELQWYNNTSCKLPQKAIVSMTK